MKKLIIFLLTAVCIVCFIGCENAAAYQPTDVENVSIRITDVTASGATVIIKDSNEEPYLYGDMFEIQRYTQGEWHEVDTIIDNYGFDLVGYLPNLNGEIKFDIQWEWLYGKLPSGDYRLLKYVDSKMISVEFCIQES